MTAQVVELEQYRRVDLDDAILDELPGFATGVEVRFHPSMPPHVQRLLGTLGARVVFDPTVAPGEAWNK